MKNLLPQFKETSEQRNFRQVYMKSINKAFKYDESMGIMDIGEDRKISLQDIYVPLRFSPHDLDEDSNPIITESIIDLFQRNRKVVLSGKPGSGKTTLSRSIINALSSDNLTAMAENFGRRLPIYVKLRDYKIDTIDNFQIFLNEYITIMNNTLKIDITVEDIEFYLRNGWCFLIFDGIDEVGNENNRLKVRDFILKHFDQYNKENYILITSRPTGLDKSYFFNYTKHEEEKIQEFEDLEEVDAEELNLINQEQSNTNIQQFINIDFNENEDITYKQIESLSFPLLFYITSFNDVQIKQYSENWFKLRDENPSVIQEKVNDFTSSIEKIKNLSTLRRRPVFLSMMIHIHTTKGKLPYSRAMAYRYMVEAYIEHIDIARRLNKHYDKWSFEDKERVLEGIAYKLHSSVIEVDLTKEITNNASIQITLSKEELQSTIKQIIEDEENKERWQTVKEGDEKALLEFYISRTGLLHEPEENKIQFSHLSFQEYLTAHYIYKKVIEKPFEIEETIKNEILNKLNDSKWNEVVLLFFSLYKDATDSILDAFYPNNPSKKDFIQLIIKLLDSIEYGIKKSNVEKWLERIIQFLPEFENRQTNKDIESSAYTVILEIYNNPRIENYWVETYAYNKLKSCIQKKAYIECENILYLLSKFRIQKLNTKKLIQKNIDHFLNEKLFIASELLLDDIPSINTNIYQAYSLNDIIIFNDTTSRSIKDNFIYETKKDWHFYFIRLHWKIINLYANIEFNRLIKNHAQEYTIKRFKNFQFTQNRMINNNWLNYWYRNIWLEHKDGLTLNLNNDKLFHHYEYYIKNDNKRLQSSYKSKSQTLQVELDNIKNNCSKYTLKSDFFSAITIIFFTNEQIEKEYNIDLSVPWKSYQDFIDIKKILLKSDLLYNYLKEKTGESFDKKQFKIEVEEYMSKDYSIKKLLKIISDNEKFYEINNYETIKKKILNQN